MSEARVRPAPPLSSYQWFCRHLLMPAGDALFGYDVTRRFRELQAFQWRPLDDIERYRSARLGDLLAVAADRVPFYREYFHRAGLSRESIRGAADLRLLPVIGKEELRNEPDRLMVDGYRGSTIAMKSSGSTGVQTTVYLDKACNAEVFATQLLYLSWGGFAMGKPHFQTGMTLDRSGLKAVKDRVFRCTYTSGFDLTDERIEEALTSIARARIGMAMGYASSLYVIARYLERTKRRLNMESVFTWGDSLFPHYRELIEATFGCRVTDCYGLGEGLQCAAQCEAHDALHEHMHGVIVEIVDRDGQPMPDGELGRVVVTRLEPGPMPLIRYDTGDVAAFVPGACSCGRGLRRLSRVQGRATDIITSPGGDRLIVHVFTQIFEMIPEIRQFQVRQADAAAIRILYVPSAGFRPEILEDVRREIGRRCRVPPAIGFEEVADIPLEASNKRRFVISSVPF